MPYIFFTDVSIMVRTWSKPQYKRGFDRSQRIKDRDVISADKHFTGGLLTQVFKQIWLLAFLEIKNVIVSSSYNSNS